MAVELEIRDGDPWWLSPDIWTVPHQPDGPPGMPVAGQPCFLWALVRNNGRSAVTNATVRFYWANPAIGFDCNTATEVGTSFVNLGPGAAEPVLCLAPWVPEYVNDGHECVLAEAFHDPLDPLPATPEFNVPTDRHVAQRNLSVLMAEAAGFFRFAMLIHNTNRKPRRFRLEVAQGSLGDLKALHQHLGRGFEVSAPEGKLTAAAFVDDRCAGPATLTGGKKGGLELTIPGNEHRASTLIGKVEGGGVLIHVRQTADDRSVGGLSVLVIPAEKGKGRGKERSS